MSNIHRIGSNFGSSLVNGILASKLPKNASARIKDILMHSELHQVLGEYWKKINCALNLPPDGVQVEVNDFTPNGLGFSRITLTPLINELPIESLVQQPGWGAPWLDVVSPCGADDPQAALGLLVPDDRKVRVLGISEVQRCGSASADPRTVRHRGKDKLRGAAAGFLSRDNILIVPPGGYLAYQVPLIRNASEEQGNQVVAFPLGTVNRPQVLRGGITFCTPLPTDKNKAALVL